jgi:hypothetical protein
MKSPTLLRTITIQQPVSHRDEILIKMIRYDIFFLTLKLFLLMPEGLLKRLIHRVIRVKE